jgi:putative nucleotidyltransferase with HDIG domain
MFDKQQERTINIEISQLCVGIYVFLDIGWLEHAFPLNNFKIKNDKQIIAIKQLGLKNIRVSPRRSDCRPLVLKAETGTEVVVEAIKTAEEIEAINKKKARIERLARLRATAASCEKIFLKASDTLKSINRNIFSQPQEAFKSANELIEQMLGSLLIDKDIAIHLMNDKISGEEIYLHSMNVAVLSMMLAKELGFSSEEIKQIGIACLFHDIGKVEIPYHIVNNTRTLTRPELNILKQHCHYGEVIGKTIGLAEDAIKVIAQHHEYADGSGYPSQLAGSQISKLASVVTIVNTYDNFCNHADVNRSLSPNEALSFMFAHQRNLFDAKQLSAFIRCLGIYPPGTIVKLSNEMTGMVVSVNSGKPLRPCILVYDATVPKAEAIIIDLLHEPDISVTNSMKPKELPLEIYNYLSPRKRMSYFIDTPEAAMPSNR